MQFKEVIGQQEIKTKLTGMAGSGKIPHALMLLGPEGNGNLALALSLAQYIQCENKQPDDSCGVCSSCRSSQRFMHPDVHFTFPFIKSDKKPKEPICNDFIVEWRTALTQNVYLSYYEWMQSIGAENKIGNITVVECRQIIQQLSLKTYTGGYKIQIIWMAEYLGLIGNTLLKTIEEPPPNTIIILIAENSELVINTILSRTQLIKTNAIEDADVKNALLNRFEMDENAAKRIARISDGNFNAALNYASGEENANDKLLHRWLVCCFKLKDKNSADNSSKLLEWVEEISKIGRENQKIFLKYALFFLRECSLISLYGNSEKLDGEELKFAANLSAKLEPSQLEKISKFLNQLFYHIERNGNPKILFVSNSFKIASVFKNEEVHVD